MMGIMANTNPSVPKLFKNKWCSKPRSSKAGEKGIGSSSITNEKIQSVGRASNAAICISQPKKVLAFYGRLTLKRGVKITICWALIMSQRYCKDDACRKLTQKLKTMVSCVPESRIYFVWSSTAFRSGLICLGTVLMRTRSSSNDNFCSSSIR